MKSFFTNRLSSKTWIMFFFAGQILEVGGFNPFEKSARQIGPSPQGSGENQKKWNRHLGFFPLFKVHSLQNNN